jgi:hypothetical protein
MNWRKLLQYFMIFIMAGETDSALLVCLANSAPLACTASAAIGVVLISVVATMLAL